jgi:hypothetical protein
MATRPKLMVTREKKVWVAIYEGGIGVYPQQRKPVCGEGMHAHRATLTWDEPARCENCGKPATGRYGDEMVDLCGKCVNPKAKKAPRRTMTVADAMAESRKLQRALAKR